LKRQKDATPLFLEVWLEAHKTHAYNRAELHLKTPNFDLDTHDESTDVYVALDNAIDKMVALVKKEQERVRDKDRKAGTEKDEFSSDKYTLSD